jgi:hypothetical protein
MARIGLLLLLGACLLLAACEPIAIAIVGAGASTALRYNLDGTTARTFTASTASVKSASIAAAERMGLALGEMQAVESGEVIQASAPNRSIEIELESITPQATRLRVTARSSGLFFDNATATELVQQTERILEAGVAAKLAPPAAAAGGSPRLTSN